MTDKSRWLAFHPRCDIFIKAGMSYDELVEELKEKFNLSDWSARQIIAGVLNWLEEDGVDK